MTSQKRRRLTAFAAVVLATAMSSLTAFAGDSSARHAGAKATVVTDLWFELVGQFQNSGPGVTPETHIHYGYLAWIKGVSAYAAPPRNETNARFTFFADGRTSPVIVNGPLRAASRTGTLALYDNRSTNGDWTKPDTFRDGTPILRASYRHEPVTSTLTGAVNLFSEDTITFTRPFETSHGLVQLGKVGETFIERYTGQSNMPGPPSGYFIGYAVSR